MLSGRSSRLPDERDVRYTSRCHADSDAGKSQTGVLQVETMLDTKYYRPGLEGKIKNAEQDCSPVVNAIL